MSQTQREKHHKGCKAKNTIEDASHAHTVLHRVVLVALFQSTHHCPHAYAKRGHEKHHQKANEEIREYRCVEVGVFYIRIVISEEIEGDIYTCRYAYQGIEYSVGKSCPFLYFIRPSLISVAYILL